MRRTSRRALSALATSSIAAGLLAPLLVSSCAPAAVMGTAIVVNDEYVDNAVSAIVPYDAEHVWAMARSSVSHMTTDLLDIDPDLRTIKTYVDGAAVLVQIETFDVGETRIRVAAKRYLVFSDEVAGNVRDGIVRDLG